MDGIKIGFKFVNLAKSWNRGIGNVRLKDGSSVKFLGDPSGMGVDIFRVKNGRLLEAKGFKGPDTISEAANDIGYIAEKLALNADDVSQAWIDCFNVIV